MTNTHSEETVQPGQEKAAPAACEAAALDRGLLDHLKEYAREKPEVAAIWCLGIGFILGWKLKPW